MCPSWKPSEKIILSSTEDTVKGGMIHITDMNHMTKEIVLKLAQFIYTDQ